MALRTMRLEGDEILRKKSKLVNKITDGILILLDDMAETLEKFDGVGLAAPQVGVLRRIVIIDVGEGVIELINPEIVETKGTQCKSEGCLSIPGKSGKVERPEYVKVRALDRNGEEIIVEGEEVLAVALCHEIDHLDGIMYIDKAIEMLDAEDEEDEDDEE